MQLLELLLLVPLQVQKFKLICRQQVNIMCVFFIMWSFWGREKLIILSNWFYVILFKYFQKMKPGMKQHLIFQNHPLSSLELQVHSSKKLLKKIRNSRFKLIITRASLMMTTSQKFSKFSKSTRMTSQIKGFNKATFLVNYNFYEILDLYKYKI